MTHRKTIQVSRWDCFIVGTILSLELGRVGFFWLSAVAYSGGYPSFPRGPGPFWLLCVSTELRDFPEPFNRALPQSYPRAGKLSPTLANSFTKPRTPKLGSPGCFRLGRHLSLGVSKKPHSTFGKKSKFLSVSHTWVCCRQTFHEEMNIVWFQQDFYFRGGFVESQLCYPVLASLRSAAPPHTHTLTWKRSFYKADWIPWALVSRRWVLLHVLPQPSGTWLCAAFHTLSPALSGP